MLQGDAAFLYGNPPCPCKINRDFDFRVKGMVRNRYKIRIKGQITDIGRSFYATEIPIQMKI